MGDRKIFVIGPELVQRRVDAGAKYLNGIDPLWPLEVNPEVLDMSSGMSCILGQAFREYSAAKLQLGLNDADVAAFGFEQATETDVATWWPHVLEGNVGIELITEDEGHPRPYLQDADGEQVYVSGVTVRMDVVRTVEIIDRNGYATGDRRRVTLTEDVPYYEALDALWEHKLADIAPDLRARILATGQFVTVAEAKTYEQRIAELEDSLNAAYNMTEAQRLGQDTAF